MQSILSHKLFDILENSGIEWAFVGGYVRDWLMSKKTTDIDIAINAPFQQFVDLLIQNKINIKVNTRYLSVFFKEDTLSFELTCLRRDIDCDGRFCNCVESSSFEEDSRRRDFTINALYMSKNAEILDFHGGIADIRNKRVNFIGDPEQRVDEDYLRILRYYRFCSLLGDSRNQLSCILKQKAKNLKKISIERIQSELLRMLVYEGSVKILELMEEDGILKYFPGKYDISRLKRKFERCRNPSPEEAVFNLIDHESLTNSYRFTRKQKEIFRRLKNSGEVN